MEAEEDRDKFGDRHETPISNDHKMDMLREGRRRSGLLLRLNLSQSFDNWYLNGKGRESAKRSIMISGAHTEDSTG